MDALSSQSTVAGYKAVVAAADRLPRLFPLLMTAAGTVAPAKVLVLGAGRRRAAGDRDRAPARRRRLGLRRPAGGAGAGREPRRVFLDLGIQGAETSGGYAAELTAEEQARQQGARGADPGVRRRRHDGARSGRRRRS